MAHDIDYEAIVDTIAGARGGVRHVVDRIDPKRTAQLVIDMQNGFVEEGAPVEVPAARSISGNINRISSALRAAGGHNFFVQYTTPDDIDEGWSVFLERLGAGRDAHREGFTQGHHYWQLWPELDVAPEDTRINKHRFSAFTHGTSDLHAELQARGIDTVIVTGTLTNCCCESTARDAMQHNYRTLFATDANAALSDDAHAATLQSLGFLFADLYSARELVELIEA